MADNQDFNEGDCARVPHGDGATQEPAPPATGAQAGDGAPQSEPSKAGAPGASAPLVRSDAQNDGEAAADAAPALGSPGASLIPFLAAAGGQSAPRASTFRRVAGSRRAQASAAAAVIALVCLGAAAATMNRANSQRQDSQTLAETAQTVQALRAKIAALETARPREQAIAIRKAVGEARVGLASTHEISASIAQINARLDRLEREQTARVEKLGERLDHEAAARSASAIAQNADLTARIEKLETKITVAAIAPRPVPPAPQAKTTPVAANPGVSHETTGSIPRPHAAVLPGWTLRRMRDGLALVEGRGGLQEVAPGDVIPGAGRVERFEKQGRGWVVVTNLGIIAQGPGPGGYAGFSPVDAYGPARAYEGDD